MSRSLFAALLAAFFLASCAAENSSPTVVSPQAFSPARQLSAGHIKHVILIIQENRSFNNLFATFPGANGTTTGYMETTSGPQAVQLRQEDLAYPCDFGHSYKGFLKDYDSGAMDGFNYESAGKCHHGYAKTRPYQYVKVAQIQPYWDIANTYVLADNMFQTQGSNSYTAHQDLIRGGTMIDPNQDISLVDQPSHNPWGCDAPSGTVTSLLQWTGSQLNSEPNAGPFPCTNQFPYYASNVYKTLRDLLDQHSITWKYYSPAVKSPQGPGVGGFWNAFDTIAAVRYGPEWGTNVTTKSPYEKWILRDIKHHRLKSVSWVIPDDSNSDHPGTANDNGPSWVASVVNAVGKSSYWKNTAIIIVWDDWGGFYDAVPPPLFDHWGGLGFRVPMLIVSPYARIGSGSQGGYISNTQYEFGSILKFIENNWNLGSLGTTDVRANSIIDSFDFSQSPRTFTQIPSPKGEAFFEHQPPSFRPPDSE